MAYAGTWRVVDALDVLLAQINAAAPGRSKASDGSIADDEHEESSDHYPKVLPGLGSIPTVTARDFTHDPGDGADMAVIAEALRLSRDPRIKYVIFSRRIFSATTSPWVWRPYGGDNPHTAHAHVSVVASAVADDVSLWEIGTDMTPDQAKMLEATNARVLALLDMQPAHKTSWSDANPNGIEQVDLVQQLNAMDARVAALAARVEALGAAEAARDGADAQRDADLRMLLEQHASGQLSAEAVVQRMGDLLSGQA